MTKMIDTVVAGITEQAEEGAAAASADYEYLSGLSKIELDVLLDRLENSREAKIGKILSYGSQVIAETIAELGWMKGEGDE